MFSFKHFFRTGKFTVDDKNQHSDNMEVDVVMDQGIVMPTTHLINESEPLLPSSNTMIHQKHTQPPVNILELQLEDLQRPQDEVARQYGINKSIFSKIWKNSNGRGVRWPYRRLCDMRSKINELCKTEKSMLLNQETITKLQGECIAFLQAHNRRLQVHQSYFENRRKRKFRCYQNDIGLEILQFAAEKHLQLWSPTKLVEISPEQPQPIVDTSV